MRRGSLPSWAADSDAQVDQDNDGICEPGVPSDGPGDRDPIDDNCPETLNPAQNDFDGDLAGDARDPDDDDGFTDADEDAYGSRPYDAARTPEASDLDLASCHDGVDNDGDGSLDLADDGCTWWERVTRVDTRPAQAHNRGGYQSGLKGELGGNQRRQVAVLPAAPGLQR